MQDNYTEHDFQNKWQNIILQSEQLKDMAICENWENFLNASNKYAASIERFFKTHGELLNKQSGHQDDIESLIKTDHLIQEILKSKNKNIANELLSIQKRKFAENAYHFMKVTQH